MPKLNLLVVTDCAHGGTYHVATLLADGLRNDFDLTLTLPSSSGDERPSAELDHLGVKIRFSAFSYENLDRSTYAIDEASDILEAVRPDIILFVDGAELASLLAIKKVAAQRSIPYVVVVNLLSEDTLSRFAPFLEEAKASLSAAEKVVFVSEASLARCRTLLQDVPFSSVAIPNCVADAFFEARDEEARRAIRLSLGIAENDLLCVTAARIEHRKGQRLGIAALGRLKAAGRADRLRWAFAGRAEPFDRAELEKPIGDLGVGQHVSILGERRDIGDLLDASDLFILTSYAEGMPLCIIEAMAKGVPVVATAIDGIVEQVDESCGVLLPPPHDNEEACIAALAGALNRLDNDRERLARMGASARKRARENFHRTIGVARYLQLLKDIPGAPILSEQRRENLRLGTSLNFANRSQIWNHIEDGWSACEQDGIWTSGTNSTMRMRFSDDVSRIRLRFQVAPFQRRRDRTTRIFANDAEIGKWRARPGHNSLAVEIDLDDIGRDVLLRFENPGAVRPCDIGMGKDWRELALFFRRVDIDPAVTPSAFRRATERLQVWMGSRR